MTTNTEQERIAVETHGKSELLVKRARLYSIPC